MTFYNVYSISGTEYAVICRRDPSNIMEKYGAKYCNNILLFNSIRSGYLFKKDNEIIIDIINHINSRLDAFADKINPQHVVKQRYSDVDDVGEADE